MLKLYLCRGQQISEDSMVAAQTVVPIQDEEEISIKPKLIGPHKWQTTFLES
jgi:hypothetical protein